MEESYLDILKDWESRVADPAVYEHLDVLFPEFSFRRMQQGSDRDHWASRYKMDLSLPRVRNAEKTVVYRSEMRFREQGDWSGGLGCVEAGSIHAQTRFQRGRGGYLTLPAACIPP